MPHSVEKDFIYTFETKTTKSKLCVPITLPICISCKEFVARLVQAHNLPCFIEEDLERKLQDFVNKETYALHDQNADEAISNVKNGAHSDDDLIQNWLSLYNNELKLYAKPYELSRDEKFGEVYHTLIHSPALETLLNLEHEYSLGVEHVIRKRDQDLQHLLNKQRQEMDEAVQNVGVVYKDVDINKLAQKQFETTQMIEDKWRSELNTLQDQQKAEYREWVFRVHEDSKGNVTLPSYVQRLRNAASGLPEAEEGERQAPTRLEESFTIHLGAQMKTTHNLRLLCADILELCKHKPHTVGGVVVPQPQRLQTAMSLYSNSLCGMVMLVDNRLNSYTGIKQRFANLCEHSTDFHFPPLNQQFEYVEQQLPQAAVVRAHRRLQAGEDCDAGDALSLHSSTSSSSSEDKDKGDKKLHCGDFFLTKHSNLSEVHVVFHLVSDENIRTSDITSRHPVILSIRNIIKLCFRYDIHTLTIPLLLTHEMTEEMTIPWCMKRAELMFKCVKGFMIEMATYSSQESRTIQFLVPRGLSEEMFYQISNMIPSIFRLSNPLVVKSS
ncbi:protein c12orf4 homolog [Plakobranchus ocellatus]|uniref:Protein c12orf4 homolog n=1 Tax=Plakobranchus ocellatus TaxID=259542 RepID=A0AAV4DCA1_9GAST|nr:protein c12orf4 homolog [Plakobranchus ocellatus]